MPFPIDSVYSLFILIFAVYLYFLYIKRRSKDKKFIFLIKQSKEYTRDRKYTEKKVLETKQKEIKRK